eukprot:scaffold231901_cov28-Tisochrysis_lutea.AAC.1
MQRRAAAEDGEGLEMTVGSVVQLALSDVDRAKFDHTNATLVVVEKTGKTTYRVANRNGVYKENVSRAYLKPLPQSTPVLLGLHNVLNEWQGMPSVGIRQIAASLSHAGGQGMLHCACAGMCETHRCKCRKAGRECNSRSSS